jgi:hypothetical protein
LVQPTTRTGSRLQERQVWYQFIQPLVTPSLVSIVGVKGVEVVIAEATLWMGEAAAGLAKRTERRNKMRRLVEGIVMFVGLCIKVSVFLYAVVRNVARCRCS